MSNQDSYTVEEWKSITTAPMLAGSYISMADIGITSLAGETAAMLKAMTGGDVPADASDLVANIVAHVKQMSENKEKMTMPELTDDQKKDPAATKAALLAEISEATDAVAAKGSAAEAAAYKQWLLGVATATAEAAREGGLFGLGGTRVSDDEKAALAKLSAAMGL